MPLIGTEGAASAQGFGMFSARPAANFIEDVFSTFLYTGNGSTQTIGNGIQLGAGATSPGWITSLASSTQDRGNAVAVGSAGDVYVVGISSSVSTDRTQLAKYSPTGVLQWQLQLNISSSIRRDIALDASDNVYICAEDGSFGNILKYNSAGVLQWQRRFANRLEGIAVDSSANVYVCGNDVTSGTTRMQIAKFDTSGTIQWQRSLGAASRTVVGLSAAVDSSGNFYIAGYGSNPGFSGFAALVVKYDTNGNLQWQRAMDRDSSDFWNSVSLDSSANVYVAGGINETSFGATLVKYDTSGAIQWQRRFDFPSSFSNGRAVATPSGDVYLTDDRMIAKFNTNGVQQWQRNFSGLTLGISADNLNSIYITGYFNFDENNLFVARLPNDGSGTGVYNVGTGSIDYTPSNIPVNASPYSEQATPYTSSTTSLSVVTPSYTSTASSLTSSTTALVEGPGKGGLVWTKVRNSANSHCLFDTVRGVSGPSWLISNTASAAVSSFDQITGFLSNSYSLGGDGLYGNVNVNGSTYASWTFREQPRFFDIVTYTGNGANRTIAHNLESVPGCIMVKRLDATADWQVYHRSLANTQYMVLNSTVGVATGATRWNSTTPTSTVFSLGTDATVNANGGTYVAYIFAHNAGGFGATGADNVISCGSYTGTGSTNNITLGYEPQWLLIKVASGFFNEGAWLLMDTMRGLPGVEGQDARRLFPNASSAENGASTCRVTSTGFQVSDGSDEINNSSNTYIYIAIRRGPMRTPTSGTQVYQPFSLSSTSTDTLYTTGFPVDMAIAGQKNSNNASDNWTFVDRLRGMTANSNSDGAASRALLSTSTAAEAAQSFPDFYNVWNTGLRQGQGLSGASTSYQFFRRAPGFFDVVCYTGTGANRTVSHNLGVAPELIIIKARNSGSFDWSLGVNFTPSSCREGFLNRPNALVTVAYPFTFTAQPTPTQFSLASFNATNQAGTTYVAYLFASCPGVSRVGTYTGNGSTQTIDCGFSSGARFVLIKRTDSTGGWYVWDTARGIVAGNDPYFLLNDISAEVTTTDWVDTAASGFELSNAGANLVNTNGGSYIFLAIA